MKKNTLVLALVSAAMFIACNSREVDRYEVSEITRLESPPAIERMEEADEMVKISDVDRESNEEIETTQPVVSKKKIIKDGNLSVKTEFINTGKKNMDALVKKLNGYYEREDLNNNDHRTIYDLKIRVPADKFEQLLEGIENGKDEIMSKSIRVRDITSQYMDIETRLANKREYLKRYRELLAKAKTVEDILTIEENMRTLQEEIESKEVELKYLSDQVAFSTLNMELYKEKEFVYKAPEQDKFSERVKKSLGKGWTSMINFVLGSISNWPYLVLILIAFFIFKRIRKNRKQS